MRLLGGLLALLVLLGTALPAAAAETVEVAPVSVPMVDGVTEVPRGTATVRVPGATGVESAELSYVLHGLQPGVAYHLIAYCTFGPTATCVPRNWIPSLTDYVHDLGWRTADAQGRIGAAFTIDPLPLGSYGWHVVASWQGFERYPVVTTSTHKHVHNQAPHELEFTVQVTYAGLCQLTRQYVTKHGVANSLCAKLRAAHASELRVNAHSRTGQLGAYVREVAAQRAKSMTADDAATLTRYANMLLAEPVAVTTAKAKAKQVAKTAGAPGNKRGFAPTAGHRAD